MAGLAVSDIVDVSILMEPIAVPLGNFGVLCLAGPTPVIDVKERIRAYATLNEVAVDFSATDPEYLAADVLFAQSPRPALCYIGRFAQTATNAVLHGGIMTAAQQVSLLQRLNTISDGTFEITIDGTVRTVAATAASLTSGFFTASAQSALLTTLQGIANGGFTVTVDGTVVNLTALDFTAITDLAGAAKLINDFPAFTAVATCTWVTGAAHFRIAAKTTGPVSTMTYASAPASGTDISLNLQLTALTGALLLQGSAGMDFTGITNLNGAASIVGAALAGGSCGFNGSRFDLSSASAGPASLITYASPAGTGQDVSSLLRLTQVSGASVPVNGIAAETPLQAAIALRARPEWYCLEFALATDILQSDYLAVAGFLEGATPISLFGYTTQATNCLDPAVSTDIMSEMQAEEYSRTFGQFSSTSKYAAVSLFGRFATVDYEGLSTVITGKFKQEPDVQGEILTETEARTLKAKSGNVYVYYANGVPIIQEAVMANGFFIDERIGLDWLANRIQTDLFNVLYLSTSKIPQTDAGTHILLTTVAASCQQGVVNGLIASGQWNGPPVGQLLNGQQLPNGYYVMAPLVATQPPAQRAQRIAPDITACVKLAGAVHFSGVTINVDR